MKLNVKMIASIFIPGIVIISIILYYFKLPIIALVSALILVGVLLYEAAIGNFYIEDDKKK